MQNRIKFKKKSRRIFHNKHFLLNLAAHLLLVSVERYRYPFFDPLDTQDLLLG